MNVNLNSNWFSIMSKNSLFNNLASSSTAGKNGSVTSLDNGTDSVQISKEALDALKALMTSVQSQSTDSGAKGFSKMIKDKLDGLVTAGTITSDQETAVQNVLTPPGKGASGHHHQPGGLDNLLDGLITDGTITQDQKTALEAALKPSADSSNKDTNDFAQKLKDQLDSLVTAGTITSDQATAVEDALKPPASETANSETANKDDNGLAQKLKDQLDSLVTAGTITPDQETALQNVLTAQKSGNSHHHHHHGHQGMGNKLDSLVSQGTITQDQETAIENAFKTDADAATTTTTVSDSSAV